jgi:hypothetical protein
MAGEWQVEIAARLSGSARAAADHAADTLQAGITQEMVRQPVSRWLPTAREQRRQQPGEPVRPTEPDLKGSRLYDILNHNLSPSARQSGGRNQWCPHISVLFGAYRGAFMPSCG